MEECILDSLRGYSHKLPNSIVNCPNYIKGGVLMPLANSLQFFDGQKSISIFKSKRQISAYELKGNIVSIGQKANPGQLISAMLFDLFDPTNYKTFNYQKSKISMIATSSDASFFCTIGSSSQNVQQLTIIQTENQSQVGTRIFYSKTFQKQKSFIKSVKFSNKDPHFFVLLRTQTIMIYRIDTKNQIVNNNVVKGSKVRQFNSIIFSPDDQYLYVCSKNGDISQISIKQNKQVRIGPRKRVITKGITNIRYLQPNQLIITGKQGFLGLIQLKNFDLIKQIKLHNEIFCISQFSGNIAYLTTTKADVYLFDAQTFNIKLIYTTHCTKINALQLLKDFSDIFGTAAGGQIVIWNTKILAPIIKIQYPKIICFSLHFSKNGKYIISGWNDDSIRIFSPKNGKLLHTISNCALNIITVMRSDDDSTQLICGGQNGVIRLWNLQQNKIFGLILGSLSYHNKRIHDLSLNPSNRDQLISCCQDGFYGIWNLKQFQLQNAIQISNFLKQIHFINQFTIRIIGSGNKLIQCNVNDGHIIKQKQLQGSNINSMCRYYLSNTQQYFTFYSNNTNYINYFTEQKNFKSSKTKQYNNIEAFGQVTKILLTSDNQHILAITQNGIILKFKIILTAVQQQQL